MNNNKFMDKRAKELQDPFVCIMIRDSVRVKFDTRAKKDQLTKTELLDKLLQKPSNKVYIYRPPKK